MELASPLIEVFGENARNNTNQALLEPATGSTSYCLAYIRPPPFSMRIIIQLIWWGCILQKQNIAPRQ